MDHLEICFIYLFKFISATFYHVFISGQQIIWEDECGTPTIRLTHTSEV